MYCCGCSYTVNQIKHYLPQVQLDAHTIILSSVSRTTLKQTFSNPSPESIKQCIYTFPMYDGVSVVAFTCRIGSTILQGVVKERSQAQATYHSAVARGETAGLLEQLPEASDVFSTRLGNIPPNEKVHVEITYVGELKHDAEADGIRHTLPTYIAPRYGSLPSSRLEGTNAQETGGISITVDVSMAKGSFIRGVQSPTHPIAVTMGNTSTSSTASPAMHQASATLSLGSTELDKDFILVVLTKDTGMPKALFETHQTLPNQRAMLLTLVPNFSLPPSTPEIVFVADRSGSMAAKIPTLISALKIFLKSLPVGITFNLCSFGSNHSFLWPKSQAYSRDSVAEALAHVEGFKANYGGTETFDALKATIDNRYKDIPCEVMLLTDGDIWNQGRLFSYLNDEVKKSDSSLRIFALGIGNEVSHALIEGVARAGNGFAQSITQNEKLDSKVIRMLKAGLSPHTTDYSLEVRYQDADEGFEWVDKLSDALKVMLSDGATMPKPEAKENDQPISFFESTVAQPGGKEKPPSADNEKANPFAHLPAITVPKIMQSPQSIPPLFPFSRISVYLMFSGYSSQKIPKSVVLRAKSDHGPLELEIPVEILPNPGQTIHQLAARKAIQELEEGRGWIHEAQDDSGKPVKEHYASRFSEMVQREAVRMGVQFQVGGKWCSFVAVKDKRKAKDVAKSDSDNDTVVLTPPDEDEYADMEVEEEEEEAAASMAFDDQFSYDPCLSDPVHRHHKPDVIVSNLHFYQASPPSAQGMPQARVARKAVPLSPFGGMFQGSRYAGMANMTLSHDRRFTTHRSGDTIRKRTVRKCSKWFGRKSVRHGGDPKPSEELYRAQSTVAPRLDPNDDAKNDKVHAVIQMQDFEGWWEQDEKLFGIMGVSPNGQRSKEWVTVLVMKWLDVKMSSQKDVWELVAEKAKGWLERQGLDVDRLREIETEVVQYVH
ncbi:MAG: hypothetical protein Q9171_003291 [Xanthocarpia ochracea]